MKNVIYLIIIGLILFSCKNKEYKSIIDANKNPIILETIKGWTTNREIQLYVIDSCEYIGYVQGYRSDFLTHKGNCKFCKIRND